MTFVAPLPYLTMASVRRLNRVFVRLRRRSPASTFSSSAPLSSWTTDSMDDRSPRFPTPPFSDSDDRRKAASFLLASKLVRIQRDRGGVDGRKRRDEGQFKRDVADFAALIEDAFRYVLCDPVPQSVFSAVKAKAWSSDDLLPHRRHHERLDPENNVHCISSIIEGDSVDYYRLLDQYFAVNSPDDRELIAFLTSAASPSPSTGDHWCHSRCPYYLSEMEGDDVFRSSSNSQPMRNQSEGPSKDQLLEVYHGLREGLPQIFDRNLDFSLFAENVVYVNRWHGGETISVGLKNLELRIVVLRKISGFCFVRTEMQLLQLVCFEGDNIVRARWRIEGIGYLGNLGKWNPSGRGKSTAATSKRFEGVAAFYVNKSGKIGRVEVDRVITDEDSRVKAPKPLSLALVGLLGSGVLKPGGADDASPIPSLVVADRFDVFSRVFGDVKLGASETLCNDSKL